MKTERKFRPKSWRQLLESGFEPGDYPYEGLPVGSRRVALEATLWHPDVPGVVCFFRDLDTEHKYRVSVFKNQRTRRYGPDGVDFSTLGPETMLKIEIRQNRTGTFRIEQAELSTMLLADSGTNPDSQADGDGA
jgi:hypothetical protein